MDIPRAGAMTLAAFYRLLDSGMADFTQRADPPYNQRTIRCRICRTTVSAGGAHGYDEYMTGGYRFSRRYICDGCFIAVNNRPRGHRG